MRKILFPLLLATVLLASAAARAELTLLNVSYDVMRDFYKDYNPLFQKHWLATTGEKVTILQSHGGSSAQARQVIDGLEADVVTMNQHSDIDAIAQRGRQLPENWAARLPDNSAPFSSLQVIIVRKGNPKGIKDWGDLVRPGVAVIIPNPKTSGNGRYTYLAAWGYAERLPGGNERKAQDFVTALFRNVPVLDAGGRGATTTFMQRGIGDALVTFENEAEMIAREFGRGGFEVVYPSVSIEAELPVALVDKVADRKGTRKVAGAYLQYLWNPEAQAVAAENYLRPRDKAVRAKFAGQFPNVKLFGIADLGGWKAITARHFVDGGIYDQIAAAR